jgi:dihydroflavonol-4-reductase
MRALVTGGSGFVGAAVVRALLGEGVSVTCLVRAGSDRRNLDGLAVTLATGDLNDPASLRAALAGCQQLYHVAAYYSTRAEDAALLQRVNVTGTRHLLTLAAELGLARIVHTSTIGTIGRPATDRLPTEEDLLTDLAAASPYARSKLEGEAVALELAQRGAPIVVVNPGAPVGARDVKPSSTGARLLAYLEGRAPSFAPGGINFVSVEDVAQGHLLAARRGRSGARYILGHAQGNLTQADFYALMERISGEPPPREGGTMARLRAALRRLRLGGTTATVATVPGYRPQALTADPRRAIEELGLPQTPLEVAFRQAIVWFRANGYVKR